MKWRLLCALFVLASIGVACRRPIYLEYETDTQRTRPVFQPGDTVIFKTPVAWRTGRTPCEREELTGPDNKWVKCKIKDGLDFKEFAYYCTTVNCDPEVAVDEDPGNRLNVMSTTPPAGTMAAATASASFYIYLFCEGSTLKADPENHKNAKDTTVAWRVLDGEPIRNYTVTVANGTLCGGGTTTFTSHQQLCSVQDVPTVNYSITSTDSNCMTAGAGTVSGRP